VQGGESCTGKPIEKKECDGQLAGGNYKKE